VIAFKRSKTPRSTEGGVKEDGPKAEIPSYPLHSRDGGEVDKQMSETRKVTRHSDPEVFHVLQSETGVACERRNYRGSTKQ